MNILGINKKVQQWRRKLRIIFPWNRIFFLEASGNIFAGIEQWKYAYLYNMGLTGLIKVQPCWIMIINLFLTIFKCFKERIIGKEAFLINFWNISEVLGYSPTLCYSISFSWQKSFKMESAFLSSYDLKEEEEIIT